MASTTIRRGTRLERSVWEQATVARCYSLGNGFSGNEVDLEWVRKEWARYGTDAKLSRKGPGTASMSVHSNLWFEIDTLAAL